MIEPIVSVSAVAVAMPPFGPATDRRRKRLNWLSSLRAARGEGPLETAEPQPARADIADALDIAAAFRAADEADEAPALAVSAADIARRLAAAADRSLAVQARIGAAAVRAYIG